VTAPVVARAFRARGSRTSFLCLRAIALLFPGFAAPACAQVAATVSVFSDSRFRGYSLSDGRPVAILDFAYDNSSGLYGDATATAVLRRGDNPALLSFQVNGGYAKRFSSGTTLDVGATHSTYSHYSSGKHGTTYTEFYVGLARGDLSSRIFVSPHYFARGLWTVYGEVNGSVRPARNWSLDGHVGMLVPLRTASPGERYRAGFDWRIGATRELGRLSLHAAWTEGARGRGYYGDLSHSRGAVVIGASWAL
jgi:uncharacterized protein (TIGR02001 family)